MFNADVMWEILRNSDARNTAEIINITQCQGMPEEEASMGFVPENGQ